MSGAKKAPIDTTAANALHAAGQQDYAWTISNFSDLFDSVNYNVTDSDIAREAGAAPDRAAIAAQVEKERGAPSSGRGFGAAADAVSNEAEINRRFAEEQRAYDTRRSEAGAKLIKRREEEKFGRTVDKNVGLAAGNVIGAQQAATRARERMGLADPTGELAQSQRSARAYELAAAKAGAANTTRAGLRDLSIKRAQLAAGLGAGIKKMGQQSLSTAADMASSRNQYNATQVKGGLADALGSGLSGVLALATLGVGSPLLLAAGGLAGAQQGYN